MALVHRIAVPRFRPSVDPRPAFLSHRTFIHRPLCDTQLHLHPEICQRCFETGSEAVPSYARAVRKQLLGHELQCCVERALLDRSALPKPGAVQAVFLITSSSLVVDVFRDGVDFHLEVTHWGCGRKLGLSRGSPCIPTNTEFEPSSSTSSSANGVRPTIRQLGYPTKNALKGWYREYQQRLDLPVGYAGREPKFSQAQKAAAIEHYLAHDRCIAATMRALGYPGRGTLTAWVREALPEVRRAIVGSVGKRRYSTSLKQAGVMELCTRQEGMLANEGHLRRGKRRAASSCTIETGPFRAPVKCSATSSERHGRRSMQVRSLESPLLTPQRLGGSPRS